MDKALILTLKLMGIEDKIINYILYNNLSNSVIKKILSDRFLEIEYEHNLNLIEYSSKLSNKEFVEKMHKKALEIIENCKTNGIRIIFINSKSYPANLKVISTPPPILYIKGAYFTKKDIKSIGCVGTRNPTTFGRNATTALVFRLVNEEFTIISGLATGIDTLSHVVCMKRNGKTIAVLAHGLDMIYPPENKGLAEEILMKGGILLSEYPPGDKPNKNNFINRNRLISGLSQGCIVFESKSNSGTMHTVNYALKQGKKVFCPIPTETYLQSEGLIKLLNNQIAIGISRTEEYYKVVEGLGYSIRNDKELIAKRKEQAFKTILKKDVDFIKQITKEEFNKKASFSVQEDLYFHFREILKENNLTGKEFFMGIMNYVVNNYKKGDKK